MKNVEDVYPLSPMQEVMLLHAVSAPRDDVLFNQFCYEIHGQLDPSRLRSAIQQVIARHPIARTAFVWENLKQPLQVVRRVVDVPFEFLDWSDRSPAEQLAGVEAFRRADRHLGFTLTKVPLLRFTLMRLAPDSHYLVCSCHHLLMDRWCLGIFWQEAFTFYTSATEPDPVSMEQVRGFRDYINWIQGQDRSKAERYWCAALKGFTIPTPVTAAAESPNGGQTHTEPSGCPIELSVDETRALRTFARQHGLTVSTVIQGAWALLLNHFSGRADVVFGATVSGRPVDLAGVDAIIGTFINNLPVRVRLEGDSELVRWLRDIQAAHQERTPYNYVSIAAIHAWSELGPTEQLFDTLLVSITADEPREPHGLKLRGPTGWVSTTYPLTLTISNSDPQLTLHAYPGPRSRILTDTERMLERFVGIVTSIVGADPHCRLGTLADLRSKTGVHTASRPADSKNATVDDRSSASWDRRHEQGIEIAELEDLLIAEWRRVLDIDRFATDDDFFRIGGNSIHAAGLHTRLESITGATIPLLGLFRIPTVEQMARALWEQSWPVDQDIVNAIQPDGAKPPLFCVAAPEVNAVGYAVLSRHLDPEQPVYLLQPPVAEQDLNRLDASMFPSLASKCIAAIKTVQTGGPLNLVGMCSGAHLAFEMAKQLYEQDRTVGLVGIVDTSAQYTVSRLFYIRIVRNMLLYYGRRTASLARLPARKLLSNLHRIGSRRLATARHWIADVISGRPADGVMTHWEQDVSMATENCTFVATENCTLLGRTLGR